jgi:hypothetical protein
MKVRYIGLIITPLALAIVNEVSSFTGTRLMCMVLKLLELKMFIFDYFDANNFSTEFLRVAAEIYLDNREAPPYDDATFLTFFYYT